MMISPKRSPKRSPKQPKLTNTLSQMATDVVALTDVALIDVTDVTNAVVAVRNHIRNQNLIGRILLYFLNDDIMCEINYIPLLICSDREDFKTQFRSGHCGAVHSLKNTTKPWLRRHQSKLGNIINEESNGKIRITPVWKKIILDAVIDK